MYPIIFQLGPLTIYSFGAFMALAALTAVWLVRAELKRRGHNPELASTLVFAAAVGGLIGARLLFIVEEWQGFLAAPMNYILTGAGIYLVWRILWRRRGGELGRSKASRYPGSRLPTWPRRHWRWLMA